jgi:hypothetical protein
MRPPICGSSPAIRAQHGGFARAGGTHQRHSLAPLSGKRDALHDRASVAIHA